MLRSKTASLTLILALSLAALVLAPSPSRAGEDDDPPHVVRWVPRGPVQFLGGAYLGIHAVDLTPELRRHFGVPEAAGLLVGKVMEDSPAEAAGFEVGDIITAIDGKGVATHGELVGRLSRHEEGDLVTVETWRDGRRLDLSAKLEKQQLPGLPVLAKGVHFLPKGQLEGVDPEAFAHLGETFSDYFSSPEWRKSLETLEEHREGLLERLQELETRLQQMEKKLGSMSQQ